MARGGARPGAGRPRKAATPQEQKIPKPRGGARPGAGRKKKVQPVASAELPPVAVAPTGVKATEVPESWPFGTAPAQPEAPKIPSEQLTPLAYLLSIVQDENEDTKVRMQAASIAAPFVHVKPGEAGKKKERESAAKEAGTGKFAASAPPRLVHSR